MSYTSEATTTITRNLPDFEKGTENIYESLAVIARRADMIGKNLKEELNKKLDEFKTSSDSLEEIFENKEQIELSKHYEKMPKPTLIAVEEFLNDKIYYRNPLDDDES